MSDRDDPRAHHELITRLYQEALELQPERRAAFLEQICPDDSGIRKEVESLLTSNEQAGRFMTGTALEVAAGLIAEERTQFAEGHMLGCYRIEALKGAGGMGEVYRALDTRLDRVVAIKVLPLHLAASAELKQRFEREARAIASIDHPHICTLYDVGELDGIPFLIMEYLEGQTLAERLESGPLPMEQVLRYAGEIADALGTAHRRGVVHRDFKPGNIMLTKAGSKLLDFGLAKFSAHAATSLPGSPGGSTESDPVTKRGTILGTAQYMAPEQLEGLEADVRADIFAFGAVVYEMATGRKAFEGRSEASLISAIMLSEPPPISTLQPLAPPALDHLVRRCLAKNPEERWQSASDANSQLHWIAENSQQTPSLAPSLSPPRSRSWLAWSLATLGMLAVLALSLDRLRLKEGAPVPAPTLLSVSAPSGAALAASHPYGAPVVSPDGRHIVFAVTNEGQTLLYLRSLNSLEAQPLPGTADAHNPFWSPDSRSIGFFANGKLQTLDISGGSPLTLCAAGQPRDNQGKGGAWSRDGVIVFAMPRGEPLYRVSASGGGQASPVTTFDPSLDEGHRWPYFLPDGRHFLYHVRRPMGKTNSRVYVGSLDSKERKLVFEHNSSVAYAPPGYLVFVKDENLMAQPFDASRLELKGEPLRLAGSVAVAAQIARAVFSISENGVLAYAPAASKSTSQMMHFNRAGQHLGAIGQPAGYYSMRLSRDGSRIVYSQLNPGSVWLLDLARGNQSPVTASARIPVTIEPVWSPDGNQVVFAGGSGLAGPFKVYRKSFQGAEDPEMLIESDVPLLAPKDYSLDGKFLLFESMRQRESQHGLWYSPVPTAGMPLRLLHGKFNESQGRFSPDGRWVAYTSDESGRDEVYLCSFPSADYKTTISTRGGSSPFWRGDSKEIVYLSPDTWLMAVTLEMNASRTFKPGIPKPLFKEPGITVADMTADGQHFYLAVALPPPPITVVLNWTAELKR